MLTFVLLCLQGTGGQAYAQEDKAGERRIRYSSSYLKEAEIPEAPEEYLEEARNIFARIYPGKDGKSITLNFEEE